VAYVTDHLAICLSVGRSVHKVYCGKTVEWIRMLVGTVSWVGRGMGVLDGSRDRQRGEGSFGGEFGTSRCNRWGLCDVALPKLLYAEHVNKLVKYLVHISSSLQHFQLENLDQNANRCPADNHPMGHFGLGAFRRGALKSGTGAT